MRKPQIWAVLHEELRNARVIRKDVRWPSLNFSEHLRMKVFNGIGHDEMFSYMRTLVNLFVRPMTANHLQARALTLARGQGIG